MSITASNTNSGSSPIFLIINCSSLFNSACEFFTEKIELFEKGDSLSVFDSRDSDIGNRIEHANHDEWKNRDTDDEFEECESMLILGIGEFHRQLFFPKKKQEEGE